MVEFVLDLLASNGRGQADQLSGRRSAEHRPIAGCLTKEAARAR
jgi:hypothetical protein